MACSEAALADRDGDDRLSKMSDVILGHILSFLPAFEAARASVLSRRWRHVFAAVHTVSLDERERPIGEIDVFYKLPVWRLTFANVVSALLLGRQQRHGGAPLRKLRVAFQAACRMDDAVVDQWLSCAFQLAGNEVHLDLRFLLGYLDCSLHRDKDDLDEDEEDRNFEIPAPTRLFSCVALQSLRLGPCRLDGMPPAIDLPSLETLLLTRVVGPENGVQRLVTACPRLADLTLEACATVTALGLHDKRLRKLSLRCCHKLTAVTVDATELRSFEYRGDVPTPAFLTVHGRPMITSCTLDFLCANKQQPSDPSALKDFLQLFAGVKHFHLKSSSRLGFVIHDSPAQVFSPCLRHLELTVISPDKDATIVAAVTKILERTLCLETLSLFFLPPEDPLEKNNHDQDEEAILNLRQLRYDRHDAIAVVPDDADILCLRERIREINLVHYQGGGSQRMLVKFLLRHALVLDALCCVFAPGSLWMQSKLMEEMRSSVKNKSVKMQFV